MGIDVKTHFCRKLALRSVTTGTDTSVAMLRSRFTLWPSYFSSPFQHPEPNVTKGAAVARCTVACMLMHPNQCRPNKQIANIHCCCIIIILKSPKKVEDLFGVPQLASSVGFRL